MHAARLPPRATPLRAPVDATGLGRTTLHHRLLFGRRGGLAWQGLSVPHGNLGVARSAWDSGRSGPARAGLGPLSGGGDEAADTVDAILRLFTSQRGSTSLDGLLDYVPDDVLDACLERVKAKRNRRTAEGGTSLGEFAASQDTAEGSSSSSSSSLPLSSRSAEGRGEGQEGTGGESASSSPSPVVVGFKDVLEHGAKDGGFRLDAYAMRLLVFSRPAQTTLLSTLSLGQDRYLQRCLVEGASGEVAVLTFELRLQEALEPRYRGLIIRDKWFLVGITGEPDTFEDDDVSEEGGSRYLFPAPRLSPELVVLTQLRALREDDVEGVFRFASPSNQESTGPVQRFASMLQAASYAPLLGHREAELLKSMQLNATTAMVVVGVTSNQKGPGGLAYQQYLYVWVVSLQPAHAPGGVANCWMTDAVNSISSYLNPMEGGGVGDGTPPA